MRLHEIAAEIEHLLGTAVDTETGEIDSETAAALDALDLGARALALDLAVYSLGLDAEAAAVKHRAAELSARAARLERKAESLRRYIASCIDPGEKLADDRVTITWRKSEAVVIDDATRIPPEYQRTVPERREPDKAKIKEARKSGIDVPGAHVESRLGMTVK